MTGSNGSIFAIGDCTSTSYAPTAQVASQQGAYLARVFAQIAKRDALEEKLGSTEDAAEREELGKQIAKVKLRPFHYSHQGSLAYIGSDKAIADLPFMNGNVSPLFPVLEGVCADDDCCVVCEWWSSDVFVLVERVFEYAVLAEESVLGGKRLVDHEDIWAVSYLSFFLPRVYL